jgi:hypothetical protein
MQSNFQKKQYTLDEAWDIAYDHHERQAHLVNFHAGRMCQNMADQPMAISWDAYRAYQLRRDFSNIRIVFE